MAAAFECKLTLTKAGIFSGIESGAAAKRLADSSTGTPYQELMCGPMFGILAHAHCWKSSPCDAIETISEHLGEADLRSVNHPRETADLICISNLATWTMSKEVLCTERGGRDADRPEEIEPNAAGGPSTTYFCHQGEDPLNESGRQKGFTPVGVFVSELLVKLAWRDSALRDIASYFIGVEFMRASSGRSRHWSSTVYSPTLLSQLSGTKLSDVLDWNEWAFAIE